jgi:hypothetical protein
MLQKVIKWKITDKQKTCLSLDVIAVSCQKFGLLVESCEVIVEVWWIGKAPIKKQDQNQNSKVGSHLADTYS